MEFRRRRVMLAAAFTLAVVLASQLVTAAVAAQSPGDAESRALSSDAEGRQVDVATTDIATTDTAAEPPSPRSPVPATPRPSDPAPWIVAGTGIVVLVVVALLLSVGYSNVAAVRDARDGVTLSEIAAARDLGLSLTTVGWGAGVVGLALAIGGVAWSQAARAPEAPVRVTAWMDGGGGGVLVRGDL